MPDRTRRALLLAMLVLFVTHSAPAAASTPRREDRGDLIVLHVYGSYYDMGRQQVELLGPIARRAYEYHRAKYAKLLARGDWQMTFLDAGIGLLSWVGPLYEESGFFDEMHGIADALGVPRAEFLRAGLAQAFGSTVFAATRSATADHTAIIGRNVDWDDGNGTLRPVVMLVHPSNGDLAYITAGWPLIGLPTIGINEAGFALSFNFFEADETVGVLPQMRDRRALQTARTVVDGLRVFAEVRRRAMPSFMVMADATGDIAMMESTPSAFVVFRPQSNGADWFAQSNHARTDKMMQFDRYRSPDSFRRRAAMEDAVRPHVGTLTPQIAAQILRDRSNSAYVNDSVVANVFVLNAAVVHPASKTLWHSTTMQPLAPFGELVPFSVGAGISAPAALPADPRLGTPEMRQQAAVIAEARRAVRLFKDGDAAAAGAIWDRLAASGESLLQPDRLAYARAVARLQAGNVAEADQLLATLETERAPFEVRLRGTAYRAWSADRLGRRAEALAVYERARAYADAHPEYTDAATALMRRDITAGLAAPQADHQLSDIPDLQYVPQ